MGALLDDKPEVLLSQQPSVQTGYSCTAMKPADLNCSLLRVGALVLRLM